MFGTVLSLTRSGGITNLRAINALCDITAWPKNTVLQHTLGGLCLFLCFLVSKRRVAFKSNLIVQSNTMTF